MGTLSEEEKVRIREEMNYREEIRILLSAKHNKETHPIKGFLNSAFFVTVLGGIVIAFLGHLWQEASLHRQKEILRLESASQQRYDLLNSFVQNFESTMMILGTMHKNKLSLADITAKRKANETSVAPEAFNSQNRLYEDTWALYQKAPKINTYEIQIRAHYRDAAVLSALKALDAAIVNLQQSPDQETLKSCMAEIDTKFEELSNAMVTETARNEF